MLKECSCTELWHFWRSHGARSTFDYAERHMMAFQPISKAARSWSYDTACCHLSHTFQHCSVFTSETSSNTYKWWSESNSQSSVVFCTLSILCWWMVADQEKTREALSGHGRSCTATDTSDTMGYRKQPGVNVAAKQFLTEQCPDSMSWLVKPH